MLSDRQPIIQCVILLCFCAATGLLLFEWYDPLSLKQEDVVSTSLTPLSVVVMHPRAVEASTEALTKASTENHPSKKQASVLSTPAWQHTVTRHPLMAGRRPIATLIQTSQPKVTPTIPQAIQVEVRVKLETRQVELYKAGELVEQYPAAIGKDEWQTPEGVFEVLQMQQDPAWQHPITHEIVAPGPDNPLGTHWIGFWSDGTNQLGFHGTNQEDLIGQAVSHGCIRMRNQDIQKLYNSVTLGTLVSVEP